MYFSSFRSCYSGPCNSDYHLLASMVPGYFWFWWGGRNDDRSKTVDLSQFQVQGQKNYLQFYIRSRTISHSGPTNSPYVRVYQVGGIFYQRAKKFYNQWYTGLLR